MTLKTNPRKVVKVSHGIKKNYQKNMLWVNSYLSLKCRYMFIEDKKKISDQELPTKKKSIKQDQKFSLKNN